MLGWEELPRDERPPQRIWLNDEALIEHFRMVEAERDRRFGTHNSGAIEDPVTNDAARNLLVGG